MEVDAGRLTCARCGQVVERPVRPGAPPLCSAACRAAHIGARQATPLGATRRHHGVVLVKVGRGHHLADARGWAPRHRVRAEVYLGRALASDEIVIARDGNLDNASRRNLVVVKRKRGGACE